MTDTLSLTPLTAYAILLKRRRDNLPGETVIRRHGETGEWFLVITTGTSPEERHSINPYLG